jgi:hypothetical protein
MTLVSSGCGLTMISKTGARSFPMTIAFRRDMSLGNWKDDWKLIELKYGDWAAPEQWLSRKSIGSCDRRSIGS